MCQCRPADPTDPGDAADLSIMGYAENVPATGRWTFWSLGPGKLPDPSNAQSTYRSTRGASLKHMAFWRRQSAIARAARLDAAFGHPP